MKRSENLLTGSTTRESAKRNWPKQKKRRERQENLQNKIKKDYLQLAAVKFMCESNSNGSLDVSLIY